MKNVILINEDTDLTLSFNIKESWDEVYLGDFLKLMDLIQIKDKLNIEDFFTQMLCIISDVNKDDLLEIPVSELNKLSAYFNLFTDLNLKTEVPEYILLGDVIYVPKKNMSNLTVHETVLLNTIREKSKNNTEVFLGMLTILIRRGYQKEVDGKNKYFQYKINDDDIEESRKIFPEKMPSSVSIPLLHFFLSGMKK